MSIKTKKFSVTKINNATKAIANVDAIIANIEKKEILDLASRLAMSNGNGKLAKTTLVWSLPAGITCPGADQCLAVAMQRDDGTRYIKDGPQMKFRCFAAMAEAQYTDTFNSRRRNLETVRLALSRGIEFLAMVIHCAIHLNKRGDTDRVRVHESGDFFSMAYLQSWLLVARWNPTIDFYCYSKNLILFLDLPLPDNFYMVASYGGKWDAMIDGGLFPVYAKVFETEEEAIDAGLPIDMDDNHALLGIPFALLIHGSQPKGTSAAKAAYANKVNKKALKAKYALA